jgi:NADPH:quinone reductase-like Zn-dependent oxidoreductase
MKAWQYRGSSGGIEKDLQLNTAAALPKPKAKQHLVKVLHAAINPVDYKLAEIGFVAKVAASLPATPAVDFVGTVVKPAAGSSVKAGETVYGFAGTSPFSGGALAEYAFADESAVVPIPGGVDPIKFAGIPIAGITAYQSIVPFAKAGKNNLFINGGSGGTGIYAIQIAKATGWNVTTSCSTANVDLCRELGADRVIDYKQEDVLTALKASEHKFDHVVDNVSHDNALYLKSHEYTTPEATFAAVGGEISAKAVGGVLRNNLLPGILGGGKRKFKMVVLTRSQDDLTQVAKLIQEGKVKSIYTQYAFEDAPKAFEKLKTGRARGKIVIDVASQDAPKAENV